MKFNCVAYFVLFLILFSLCWIYGIFLFHKHTPTLILEFITSLCSRSMIKIIQYIDQKKLYSTCVLIDCTLSTAWLLICPDPYFLSHSISFYLFNFRLQFFSAWICAIFCRIYAILCSVQCVYSHNYPKVICFISHYFFSSIRTASLCFLSAHIVLRRMVFIYLKKNCGNICLVPSKYLNLN